MDLGLGHTSDLLMNNYSLASEFVVLVNSSNQWTRLDRKVTKLSINNNEWCKFNSIDQRRMLDLLTQLFTDIYVEVA